MSLQTEENFELNILSEKELTKEEIKKLTLQNTRLVPEFKAKEIKEKAQRHWDLFYKRNETRFFKDRRWTKREFQELIDEENISANRKLLEIGCGVGNFIFPLISDGYSGYFYACDFSPRAVELVKKNPLYDEKKLKAFQCDITKEDIHTIINPESLDIVSLIFVLSAIHPEKFDAVIKNIWKLLKKGGIILFRDYGLHDMAQIRFKPGHKIGTNFYMRQDGTTTYYFSTSEIENLLTENGFEIINNSYVHRRTINIKNNLDVPRIFVQSKFRKN